MRRVIERRAFPNSSDTTPAERTTYNDGEVRRYEGATVKSKEFHHFYGSAQDSLVLRPNEYSNGRFGRENRIEYYDGESTLKRVVEHEWEQRAPVTWWTDISEKAPPNDPRIKRTITTLTDVTPNLVSKAEYDYDDYNNVTAIREYDYGQSSPGPLLRNTEITYLTTNQYQGNVNYATDYNIHISNLPVRKIVYDSSGNLKSDTEFIYDYYGDYPLVDCPGIVQHDSGFHTGYGARGNLTEVILRNPGGNPSEIHLRNQYDIAGNMVKSVDGRGIPTDFYFNDCFGPPGDDARSNSGAPELAGGFSYAFPTRVTNRLTHTAYTKYDYYLGKPVTLEDVNGIVSSVAYNDALDRSTQGIQSRYRVGVGIPAERRQTTTTYDDANHVITTTSDFNTFNDNILTAKSYYDGLGRTRRSAAYEGATWTIKDTQFDALGRVSRVSDQYRGADPGSASPPSGLWTTIDYDGLGRVIKVTTPDDAHVDTAYSGNQTTVTDQAVKRRRSEVDALGRLVKVIEDPDVLNYVTYYSYDASGNLRLVTQGEQTRTFVYDSLSRLISATNPENGTISYAYDPNGNLIEKIDARGVRTTITYDELNRARSKVYAGTTPEGTAAANLTPPVNYFYDDYSTAPSGAPTWPGTPSKGRLIGVTYGSGSEGTYYKYDAAGRIVTNHQRIGTSNYATAYSYNLSGAVTREERGIPARRRNLMSYDAAGRLTTMSAGSYPFQAFTNLVRDISYTAFGAPQSETYGNGLIHSMSYNDRHQPAEIRLGRPDNLESVFRIGYIFGTAYDVNGQDSEMTLAHNNGNLARIKYFISGALQYTQTFQYDPLNRLSYAVEHKNGVYNDGARAWYQTFAYDQYGNRGIDVENTSDNADAANGALQLADFSGANNRITHTDYVYDAAGNLTAEPRKIYTYDAENRMVTATVVGGVTSQYVYDGIGHRVKKIAGGVATRYEYGAGGELIAERNDSNSVVLKDYFYKGGELLATTKAGGGYLYATADHLGSPRSWTDDSGNMVAGGRHDYLPFGEELFAGYGTRTTDQGYASNAQQDGQRKQFTAQERDSETGLDFFVARYYSSVQGRFTVPDSFGGRGSNPQTLNLYAYVRNNPLKYIDPTGHFAQDPNNDKPWHPELDDVGTVEHIATTALESLGSHIRKWAPISFEFSTLYMPGLNLWGAHRLRQRLYDYSPTYRNYWDSIHSDVTAGGLMAIPVVGVLEAGAVKGEAAMGEMDLLLEEELVTVGRWMGQLEYEKMLNTNMVQESKFSEGITSFALPENPMAFIRQADAGSYYVRFDVPASFVRSKGADSGWGFIAGPSSVYGRLAILRGEPVPQMPPAANIFHAATKIR
jgi:RHS repeat-associated protein